MIEIDTPDTQVRSKFVKEGENQNTPVIKSRCICDIINIGLLTDEEFSTKRIENEICTNCETPKFGSMVVSSENYKQFRPKYNHLGSRNLKLFLERWGLDVKLNSQFAQSDLQSGLASNLTDGVFVINHFLAGRSGAVSSNWSNPSEYISEYKNKSHRHIPIKHAWKSVHGKIIEELVIQKLMPLEILKHGGQFYPKNPFPLLSEIEQIPTEIDAMIFGEEPLEIFTVNGLNNLYLTALWKKISQLVMQVKTCNSDYGHFLLITRNKEESEFCFISITKASLDKWGVMVTQILKNNFTNKISNEIEDNLGAYNQILFRKLNLLEEVSER